MILSDVDIKRMFSSGEISITPKPSVSVSSVDMHLGDEVFEFEFDSHDDIINPAEPLNGIKMTFTGYLIQPKGFVLAHTKEKIKLGPKVAAMVTGISSLGRLGLFIENAGFVDPGFEGQITLELFNAQNRPFLIMAGMRICQLVFFKTSTTVSSPYNGKYVGQTGVMTSKFYKEFWG